MGIGRPTIRDKPRWMQDLFISPYKLRRGAEKMELRRFEEDKLELVRPPRPPSPPPLPLEACASLTSRAIQPRFGFATHM